jgi:hypothetical protein
MGLTLSAVAWAKSDRTDPSKLFIATDGQFLMVKAKQLSHRQILERIAKQLNFKLIIDGLLEEQYSLDVVGIPWEEALRIALFPANWAFIDESAAQEPRLIKVFVLQPHRDKGAMDDLHAARDRADTPSLASRTVPEQIYGSHLSSFPWGQALPIHMRHTSE